MAELPAKFYYIIGVLAIFNLGAIGGGLVLYGKAIWWASKLDSKVDNTTEMTIRLHKRVDRLERA